MKSIVIQVQAVPTIISGSPSEGAYQGQNSIAARPLAGTGAASYPTAALLRIPSGAQTVYIGGPGVTVANGTPFVAGEDLAIDLVGDILWAVTSTTSQTVYVLRRGD